MSAVALDLHDYVEDQRQLVELRKLMRAFDDILAAERRYAGLPEAPITAGDAPVDLAALAAQREAHHDDNPHD